MSWSSLLRELGRIAAALERIADVLEGRREAETEIKERWPET
jgi:hypothetical protein